MPSTICMVIPGFDYATAAGKVVKPQTFSVLWHGSSTETLEDFRTHSGLPARGTDIELIHHVEPETNTNPNTAFRGTVPFPLSPDKQSGACLWAQDNGLIFQIKDFPGYDVNALLEGRIPDGMGRYRSPRYTAEQEIAIPARVPSAYVAYIGRVQEGPRGFRHTMEKL
ncbi:hypothetical protein [Ralstonia pseudosolanacearum]|uniref:hypothetical protein n=1 Tax=Ralstonia pseudosolanacearum TaxID=1310165 RepID=UPI001360B27E|nr:hypothetical protein [Ralstonia pseudosolanacearum]MDO3578255.1 hypothetical protein [Ralstonia pseudosolanacearum]MDO3587565.1 hypothetical protein [Ralstonia pseudosolanacearum]